MQRIISFSLAILSCAHVQSSFAQEPTVPVNRVSQTTRLSGEAHARRLNEQGVQLLLDENAAEGLKKFEEARALNPKNTAILYNLAGLLITQGQTSKAVQVMDEAVKLDSDDPTLLNRLGEAYFLNGDIKGAISVFERLSVQDPNMDETLFRLGTLYGLDERFDESAKTLRRALQLNGDDRRIRISLASILLEQKKYDEALPLLEQAHQREKCPYTASLLAHTYQARGDLNTANQYYREAEQLGSSDPFVVEHLTYLRKVLTGATQPTGYK